MKMRVIDVGLWTTWTCSQQRWLRRELKEGSLDRHSLVYLAGSFLIYVAVIATGMKTPDLFSLPKVCYYQHCEHAAQCFDKITADRNDDYFDVLFLRL